MKSLIKRLKLKSHDHILVLNKPNDFENDLKALGLDSVHISESLIQTSCVGFALLFITSQQQLIDQMLTLLPKLHEDCILWVAFPSKTSKANIVELYHDHVWNDLMDFWLKPIRQIEINPNWNAIRFRKIEYVAS
ncbi:hypothetical protein [Mangrovimonas cancribranchiae]|uniref:Uncharacterized protein n=1 Tax=Mangrovimonas cancribranchiae TaxID=3080055 RepID=A0AAU6P9C9_9FLAO